ncbi:unnamed protein product, partial [Prunus brigantina]
APYFVSLQTKHKNKASHHFFWVSKQTKQREGGLCDTAPSYIFSSSLFCFFANKTQQANPPFFFCSISSSAGSLFLLFLSLFFLYIPCIWKHLTGVACWKYDD